MNSIQGNVQKEDMNIVIVGHVDHGKSTIIGRLLADTNSLPQGKLEQVQETCRRNARPFEYAFLLDALKDEQAQGITIDSARCFFKTEKRDYILIDAPGHVEFLKNMVTGASRAEAALLVIDANEGVQENSKRHGYLLSMLGIKQLCVLVNKMDLVGYSKAVFYHIIEEYNQFLMNINIEPLYYVPVSGFKGENIVSVSENMDWYQGPTVLGVLENFQAEKLPEDKPFRMPVQGVYKFTREGDDRRIVAGTIETGSLKVGDEVLFYPSGKKSRVKSIEGFNQEGLECVRTGYATGFTLSEQIYIKRGEIATVSGQLKPKVTTRARVNMFWLGKEPMECGKEYLLKIGTAKVGVKIEAITRVIDASNLENKNCDQIGRHEVAECILCTDKAIAFDTTKDIAQTSRFVIVDNYEIAGGGIIQEAIDDKQSWVRERVSVRDNKWEKSEISDEERAERYNQKSSLILITGNKDADRKSLGKALERKLFNEGKMVYFLSMGNLLYSVDVDLKLSGEFRREEHLRRLAEVANIILDTGSILIVTASELTQDDMATIRTIISPDKIEVLWLGESISTDIKCDLLLSRLDPVQKSVEKIKAWMQQKGIVFKPW